jgi:CDP-glucose 4,6-dehydratase
VTNLRSSVETIEANICNFKTLFSTIKTYKPEIIFHLAAQPLVVDSYKSPLETYTTNVLGTLNLLEVIRQLGRETAIVNMTSDKCYENISSSTGYTEKDPLGGRDPYSSSKACSELITRAYRESFFPVKKNSEPAISLCSMRAGNIIGGGDWAEHRLIPDFVRALKSGSTLLIRYPDAVRPWQYIFDVIYGFLLLAEKLSRSDGKVSEAWNIGPDPVLHWSVEEVVKFIAEHWDSDVNWEIGKGKNVKEEILLTLDNSKARKYLGWRPLWDTNNALKETVNWYKCYYYNPDKIISYTRNQIESFLERISSS